MPLIIPSNRLASTGYAIDQSIRFNPADSPYMSRTFGTASDANKWTLSAWSKSAQLGNGMRFLEAGGSAGSEDFVGFGGSFGYEKLYFWKRTSSSYNYNLTSTQLFRDPSAWYHFVYVFDSSNTVSTDRMKAYVNGQRITDFSTETYPSSGLASRINTAVAHRIGEPVYGGGHSDGYVAEMVFLDGQAYDPSFFGEFNNSGIWIPKDVSGLTFGNNGFYLKGADSSALGTDSSGNGNNFTTSGLSTDDQRSDSPTNNHATLNPLINSYPTYANGNLEASMTVSNKWSKAFLTEVFPQSGVWYLEGQEFNNVTYPATAVGIIDIDVETRLDDKDVSNRLSSPMSTFTGVVVYSGPGQNIDTYYYKNGSNTSTTGTPILSTSRLGFKYDADNNTFTVYDDGVQTVNFTSVNTGNYVFGVQQATGTTLSFRVLVDAAYWTETPSGITSANALTSKNIGS